MPSTKNILAVTQSICQEEGPKAITSRTIAKHLDISQMSLLTSFKNQADTRSALRERVMSEVSLPLDAIEEGTSQKISPDWSKK